VAESDPVAPQAIHALSSLPVEHRRAVVRAFYLGQTVADIAAHEHIGEGAVKSLLHEALQDLRRALQDGAPGYGPNGRHAL
jgi:RNA polymerase sigma-70 factor (ECF subfamily)